MTRCLRWRGRRVRFSARPTVVENMGNSLVARDAKIQDAGRMFEIFSLNNERDADIRKSEDNRAIAKGAFETLGPIAGSIASHVMKTRSPRGPPSLSRFSTTRTVSSRLSLCSSQRRSSRSKRRWVLPFPRSRRRRRNSTMSDMWETLGKFAVKLGTGDVVGAAETPRMRRPRAA